MAKENYKDRQRQIILKVPYAFIPTSLKSPSKSQSTVRVQTAAVFNLLENPLRDISNLNIGILNASLNNFL